MSYTEVVNKLIKELKTCRPDEIVKKFAGICDAFQFVAKEERNKIVFDFNVWAEENFKKEPLKYCYAKLLLSLNYFLNENFDAAFQSVNDTQKLFEKQGDVAGSACCLALYGGIYRTLGNIDLALRTILEAYESLKKLDVNPHFLLACSCSMGNIYFEIKKYSEALEMFQITYDYSISVNEHFWNNYALHGLAKVHLFRKEYPQAKAFLDLALKNAKEYAGPLSVSNSLTESGCYYYETGDLAEAEKLHVQALEIREQNNFTAAAVTSYIRLAETYCKNSNPEKALVMLDKGLALAEKIKIKPKLFQIHLLLSEIYREKNDLEKSLFHYREYHRIWEQVEEEENARKIKNARLLFDAEQTKKENITIKKQKEEIEQKNRQLQDTIDELTRTRVGKKAKAFTLMIAIVLFIFEEYILHFFLTLLSSESFYLSFVIKMLIIFSLKPIDGAIEHYLLKKIIRKKNEPALAVR